MVQVCAVVTYSFDTTDTVQLCSATADLQWMLRGPPPSSLYLTSLPSLTHLLYRRLRAESRAE